MLILLSYYSVDNGDALRRFYAIYKHDGCAGDELWFTVLDTSKRTCSWEIITPLRIPEFLLSPGITKTMVSGGK